MKKLRVLRFGASNGLKALCDSLRSDEEVDVKRMRLSGSTYRGYPEHFILNWGSSVRKGIKDEYTIFNDPAAVALASSKVDCLSIITDGLEYTTDRSDAEVWVNEGHRVYCRKLTHGSQGRGIVVATDIDDIVDAPLYTKGLDVHREVRVHVFAGEVIDFAQKKKMNSERRAEEGIEINEDVRSHSNGWIFARADITIPEETKEAAIRAVSELGLDFGAVDMVITPQGVSYVLEINTAPGLEGTTLQSYKAAIIRKLMV